LRGERFAVERNTVVAVAAVGIVVAGAALAYAATANHGFGALVFLTALAVGFGAPAAIVVWLLTVRTVRPDDTWLRSIAVGVLIACGALVSASFVAGWIGSARTEHRRHDAETIVPLLDEYRRAHGKFPASLDDVVGAPRPPAHFAYSSDGTKFELGVSEPSGFMDFGVGGWTYTSERRIWEHWRD
jgi:hypothetical protein